MSGFTTIHKACQEAGSAIRLVVKEDLFTVSTENASKMPVYVFLWSLDLSFVSKGFTGPENKNQRMSSYSTLSVKKH